MSLRTIIYLHGSGASEVVRALQTYLPSSGEIHHHLVGRCDIVEQNGVHWHKVITRASLALAITHIQADDPPLTGSLIAWSEEPDIPHAWLDGKLPLHLVHATKVHTRRQILLLVAEITGYIGIPLLALDDAIRACP